MRRNYLQYEYPNYIYRKKIYSERGSSVVCVVAGRLVARPRIATNGRKILDP